MSTLGRAAVVVSAGILLSRVLGFLRDVVLAGLLGRGVEADLYVDAFAIPDFLFFLMAGGYLTITFVPILTRHLADGDLEGANRSFTAVFRTVTGLMVVVTAAAMVAARPLTEAIFVEVPPERIDELTSLVRIVLPAQVFFVAGSLFTAIQYAHRRFLIPTLAPLVYNLGIIAGGVVSAMLGAAGPAGFIWGALVGAIVGNFLIQWWGARSLGTRFVTGVPMRHASIREYFALALPLMLGQSAVALDEVFLRVFGQFGGDGAEAGLNYARRVTMVPIGIIAQAAGVASYPFLANLFALGRLDDVRNTVVRAVRTGITIAGLATAGTAALAVPAVQLAFQRGEFDAGDTRVVAGLLAIYAFTIPLWAAHQVYTRGFYAQRRMWLPVGIGTATTAVAIPLYWYTARAIGAPGVALSSLIVMVIYSGAIAWYWHREAPMDGLGGTVARSAVAAIVAGAAAWGVVQAITGGSPDDLPSAAGALAGGGIVAVGAYLAVLAGLRAPELDLVRRRS